MIDESDETWTFQEGELPTWGATHANKTVPEFDFGIGVPAVTPEPLWPLFSRVMLVRITIAVGFPLMIRAGASLTENYGLVEMLIRSFVVGFGLGLGLYALLVLLRVRLAWLEDFDEGLPSMPSPWFFIAMPVLAPLVVFVLRFCYILFENRFLGVGLASAGCFALFYYRGSRPIQFMQELMLADIAVSPTERRQRTRFTEPPDLRMLAAVLLAAWLIPAYLSTAWGIVGVLVVCYFGFRQNILPLFRFAHWRTALTALTLRAHETTFEYLDYQPQDSLHWNPPESLTSRRITLILLMASLDLTLVTALTYYCPWEPFAALFLPDFDTNFLLTANYSLDDYRWLNAPLSVFRQIPAAAAYLCVAIAMVLFVVLPPLVLFVIYGARLGDLENMAQSLKRTQRRDY
jgi:hypothetical protein